MQSLDKGSGTVRNGWLAVAAGMLASACTVIEVDSRRRPVGLEADGLIDGHIAFGISGETSPLRVQVLDGRSRGAIFEIAIWKLLRFEVGLAGLDVGVGPVDVGLGVLFYDPALPPQPVRKSEPAPQVPEVESAESGERTTPQA